MRWTRFAMAFCASLITLICYAKEPAMNDTKTYCVGRFLVDLPADAEINGQAYQYMFGRIDSQRTGMDVKMFSSSMEKRASDLKAINENNGRTLKSLIAINATTEALVTSEKIYGDNNYGFEAYWLDNHHLFTLDAKDMDETVFQNKVLPRLTNELLPYLRFRNTDEIPSEPGFCLKDGFIANNGHAPQYEEAGISFKFAQWPGVIITVNASTTTKAGEKTLLERIDSAPIPAALQGVIGQIKTLRKGKHEVNGRDGEEILWTFPTGHGFRTHQFQWESLGTLDQPLKPDLTVEFETGERDANGMPQRPKLTDDEAIRIFDAVVNSVRLRPTSGGTISESEPNPNLPLGTLAQTGTACPQTGWWTCPEANGNALAGGQRQHFSAGAVLPVAYVLGKPSLVDKILRKQPQHAVNTMWQLVAHDKPLAAHTPTMVSPDSNKLAERN